MADVEIETECPRCRRKIRTDSTAFLKLRRCWFCGADVPLTRELETRLAQPPPLPFSLGTYVSCPVCDRSQLIVLRPGAQGTCQVCACPLVIPAGGGRCLEPDPVSPDAPRVRIECPSCDAAVELLGSTPCDSAICTRCSKPIDVLEYDETGGFAELILRAFRARASDRRLGLFEATQTLRWLSALDNWDMSSERVSPLPPEITAPVTQFQVLRLTGALLSAHPKQESRSGSTRRTRRGRKR